MIHTQPIRSVALGSSIVYSSGCVGTVTEKRTGLHGVSVTLERATGGIVVVIYQDKERKVRVMGTNSILM